MAADPGDSPTAASESSLQVGVAVVDITPPVGSRLCGYFNERLSTGMLDPLHAKALVLRQGDHQAALVFCDLIGVARVVSVPARQKIAQATGIPYDAVMIAATHSHTGPLYAGPLYEHFHAKAIAQHGEDANEKTPYTAFLVEKTVQAVREAQAALRPVALKAGLAQKTGLSFNRRFHMKDGSVRFNPGKLNPDIVRIAGPIDPSVAILLFDDAQNARPLTSLTVFPLHLDTRGGTLYSADYPYYLEQSLRKDLGGKFVSIFGNGTCGDINHIDFTTAKAVPSTQQIGESLAACVKAELPKLKPVDRPQLAVRSETIELAKQKPTEAEIAWAKGSMDKIGTAQLSFLDQVKAYKIMDLAMRKGDSFPADIQAFRISDNIALVGLPGEVFVELGLAIKKASPFPITMVVELANDAPDYVPTRKAFVEGSYEVVNSRVQPGGGEKIAETAIRLLDQLKPQAK
jgi:hypothetical protein